MIHYIKPALCARQVLNFASGVVATKKPYIKCCTSPAAASSRRSPQCILADKPRAGAKLVGREMVYGGVSEGRGVCTLAVDFEGGSHGGYMCLGQAVGDDAGIFIY